MRMTGTRSRRRIKSSADCSARSRSRRSAPLEQSTNSGVGRWESTSITLPVASPMEQHFDGAAQNRRQSDRDARLQHVHEGVPWRGIGVRAHEATDVIREAATSGFGDGALIRDLVCIGALRLARLDLLRRGSQLLGQTNRQELIQPDTLVGLVERIGREIAQGAAAVRDAMHERPQQRVLLVPVDDREACPVSIVSLRDVIACPPVRQHGDDHLRHETQVRYAIGQIDPACQVVGRRDALHRLFPAQSVPDVLETEAE